MVRGPCLERDFAVQMPLRWILAFRRDRATSRKSSRVGFALVNAIRQCHRVGRHLGRQQGGSVAINFALLLIPLSLAVGAAVDYSVANRAKANLDSMADAAALSAVNVAAMSQTAAE